MKISVLKHEENLKNFKLSTERIRGECLRLQMQLAYMEEDIEIREAQIERAKREGKTEFDQNRFYVKNK